MGQDLQQQQINPATLQVSDAKATEKYSKELITHDIPKPKRTYAERYGKVASGSFGGHLELLHFKEYLAGTREKSVELDLTMRMEAITNPVFDKQNITFYAVFVPNTRVWTEAKRFSAQKADTFNPPPSKVPTNTWYDNKDTTATGTLAIDVPTAWDESSSKTAAIYQTTFYRDSAFYQYYGFPWGNVGGNPFQPLIPMLPIRGYYAAWNDIFRPKIQVPPVTEFKDNGTNMLPSTLPSAANNAEIFAYLTRGQTYNPNSNPTLIDQQGCWQAHMNSNVGQPRIGDLMRVTSMRNYMTDWRAQVVTDNTAVDNTTRTTHIQTQQLQNEYRTRANNAELTVEEVNAQQRGTAVASENMCQVIGQVTKRIDISRQPQTAEGDLALGADGATSYTFIKEYMDLNDFQSPLDGYIHVFYTITTPDSTLGLHSSPRELLHINANDFYRPDLGEIKDDVQYQSEFGEQALGDGGVGGYKRRYSEYGRLPTMYRGDFTLPNFLGWNDNPRTNAAGFLIPGQNPTTLDTQTRYILQSSALTGQTFASLKSDYTDQLIRMVLMTNESTLGGASDLPPLPSLKAFKYTTPQTYWLTGSIKDKVQLPINADCITNFVNWTEE